MNSALDVFATVVPAGRFPEQDVVALSAVPVEVASSFVRATYRELKNNPLSSDWLRDLCERGVGSEFPLSEWLQQVSRMYAWLDQRGETARLPDVVEYVSCAFEGSSHQPGHNLDWYLSNYGFERATRVA